MFNRRTLFGSATATATVALAAGSLLSTRLHGTADKPVPIEPGRRAAKAIPRSKLIVHDGTSHRLLVTDRERVTRDRLQFLSA